MDDLLQLLYKSYKSLQKDNNFKFAVLRGLTNGNWVVVYAVVVAKSKEEPDVGVNLFSEIESLQRKISIVAQTIDCNRYDISCGECREDSIPQLCKGDAVHFRWIQAPPERREILSYSCLAVLKAYFNQVEGLQSCTFYDSVDGRKIAGLGIWESAQAAYRFITSPKGSPAEPYWKSLGAELRYGICEVVYVTK